MVFGTTVFETLAKLQSKARGLEDLPLLLLEHPIGGNSEDLAISKARAAWSDLEDWLQQVTVPEDVS